MLFKLFLTKLRIFGPDKLIALDGNGTRVMALNIGERIGTCYCLEKKLSELEKIQGPKVVEDHGCLYLQLLLQLLIEIWIDLVALMKVLKLWFESVEPYQDGVVR